MNSLFGNTGAPYTLIDALSLELNINNELSKAKVGSVVEYISNYLTFMSRIPTYSLYILGIGEYYLYWLKNSSAGTYLILYLIIVRGKPISTMFWITQVLLFMTRLILRTFWDCYSQRKFFLESFVVAIVTKLGFFRLTGH